MFVRAHIHRVLSYIARRVKPTNPDLRTRFPKYDIGEGSYGGIEIYSFSESDDISIGKYCSIAKHVRVLLGGEHRTDWITTYPFPETQPTSGIAGHPRSKGKVVIGNDVWLGMGAMILSGVSIGDGAVVSAGALVASDVAPYSIVAGNPARTLRLRFSKDEINALLRIRWWDWPIEQIEKELPILCSSKIKEFIALHDTLEPGTPAEQGL